MTTITTDAALYRLMTWLSPAYPVGAYSYSHGIEYAVEAGMVRDRDTSGRLDRARGAAWRRPDRRRAVGGGVARRRSATRIGALGECLARQRARWRSNRARRAPRSWPRRAPPGRIRRSTNWRCAARGEAMLPVAVGVAAKAHGVRARRHAHGLSACLRRQSRFRRRAPHSAGPDRGPARHRRARASHRARRRARRATRRSTTSAPRRR